MGQVSRPPVSARVARHLPHSDSCRCPCHRPLRTGRGRPGRGERPRHSLSLRVPRAHRVTRVRSRGARIQLELPTTDVRVSSSTGTKRWWSPRRVTACRGATHSCNTTMEPTPCTAQLQITAEPRPARGPPCPSRGTTAARRFAASRRGCGPSAAANRRVRRSALLPAW